MNYQFVASLLAGISMVSVLIGIWKTRKETSADQTFLSAIYFILAAMYFLNLHSIP